MMRPIRYPVRVGERMKASAALGTAIMVAGCVVGYVTALQALGHAGTGPAPGNENWTQGIVNAKDTYAVYALGHFREDGLLPPPRSTMYFSRVKDDEGNSLRGNCAYEVSGPAPQARWWSISAEAAGQAANGTAFTAGNAVLANDDSFKLALSRKPMAGNWLAPPDVGAMQVLLVLNEPYAPAKNTKLALPNVKRLGCE
jgi:hypothetical protein